MWGLIFIFFFLTHSAVVSFVLSFNPFQPEFTHLDQTEMMNPFLSTSKISTYLKLLIYSVKSCLFSVPTCSRFMKIIVNFPHEAIAGKQDFGIKKLVGSGNKTFNLPAVVKAVLAKVGNVIKLLLSGKYLYFCYLYIPFRVNGFLYFHIYSSRAGRSQGIQYTCYVSLLLHFTVVEV